MTARGETVTEDLVSCSIFVIKPGGVGFGRRSFLFGQRFPFGLGKMLPFSPSSTPALAATR